MPYLLSALLALLLLCTPFSASSARDAVDLQLQAGSVKLDNADSGTVYGVMMSLPLEFGFVRAETAHASSAALSFERAGLALGASHELSGRAEVFAAAGVERLHDDVALLLEDGSSRRLRSSGYAAGLELGLRLQPTDSWGIEVGVSHYDRPQPDLYIHLPPTLARVSTSFRLGARLSIVADAVSGEDYREYRLGPKWHF